MILVIVLTVIVDQAWELSMETKEVAVYQARIEIYWSQHWSTSEFRAPYCIHL